MPVIRHPDIELLQGDFWSLPFALFDANGAPLDLDGANFAWYLVDPNGIGVPTVEEQVVITPDTPLTLGTGSINVRQDITESLPCGRYFDSLRVFYDNLPSTLWVGQILVAADAASVTPLLPLQPRMLQATASLSDDSELGADIL